MWIEIAWILMFSIPFSKKFDTDAVSFIWTFFHRETFCGGEYDRWTFNATSATTAPYMFLKEVHSSVDIYAISRFEPIQTLSLDVSRLLKE